MIHQQTQNHQRRRSSVHQPVLQHHATASAIHASQHAPVQIQSPQNKPQDNSVKVEITEIKP